MTGPDIQPRYPLLPLKRMAIVRPSGVDKNVDPDERPVRLCNYLDVYRNSRINPHMRFSAGSATDAEIERFALCAGDVLITKDSETPDDIAVPALVVDGADDLICGYHLALLRPNTAQVHGAFLNYALASEYVRSQFSVRAQGITRFGLTVSSIGNVLCPRPPLSAQRAIVDFLDRETERFDALIAKKERLVELLRTRHAAEIEHTVMGRYRKDRELRPSNVDWIGEIPVDWTVRRVIQVARLESGHTPSRNEPSYWVPEECTIPWFTLGDIWQVRQARQIYVRETNEKISPTGIAHSAARLLPAETVILSRTASVGFPAVLAVPMATTQDFVNWICGPQVVPAYLYFVFRAMRRELDRLMIGSTHQTIYMPDVRAFRMPLPPLDEQYEIVGRLMRGEERTETLVNKTQFTIDRLRELRSALITAAVTGQIDPGEWRRRGNTERALEAVAAAGERAGVAS